MSMKSVFIFTAIVMFLSGCTIIPTKDIKITSEADPKVKFSGYKTYSWHGTAEIVNDPYGQWEPPGFDADSEITYLINRELRKRGMLENSSNPDVIVAFAASINMAAVGLKKDPDTKIDILANVPQGGLVVLLVDDDTGFVIWKGVAKGEVQENADATTVKARMDYAVTQMLKKIPK